MIRKDCEANWGKGNRESPAAKTSNFKIQASEKLKHQNQLGVVMRRMNDQ
jgi:hypothetical protein